MQESVDIWLTVDPDSVNEGAGSRAFKVTAEHNGDPQSDPVTIQLALAGTATPGSSGDYTAPAQATVTIPANQTSGEATLTLNILDDTETEGDETIIVGGSYEDLVIRSAVITIHDDETTYLSITGPTADVTEGSNASFTVTLSKTVAADVTVAWSAATDTAAAADLGATSGSITIPANSTTQTITVAVTDDNLSEGSETFSVELGADTGDQADTVRVKSTAVTAEATIAESDPITVSISGPTSVDEGDATSNYTVSLSPGRTPTADLTVSYGTANGTATAGTDYTAKSGTLTFTNTAAGAQTFTVQTTGDTIDEGTGESFTVTISSPSGGGGPAPSLGTSKSVTTTITDDDDAPTGITLSASPNTLGEDDSATSVTVTATLNGGTTRPSATVVTIGTLAGSATKDTDYTATTLASITIPPNTASGTGTITITPTDDQVVEGDETIVISGTTTTQVGLDVSDATITLTDDNKTTTTDTDDKDTAELSISGPSANVDEGDDATFTVTLSAAVSKEVTVAWSATGNTTDYSPDSGTVTFAAGSAANATQDIDIAVADDDLSETDETFTVTLGTVGGDLLQVTVKSSANSATATIAESDPITVSISGPSSVDEGEETTAYTVSLSPNGVTPTADLTVSYATGGGTATSGSDYTAKSGTLTFTQAVAGAQTFTVETTEDNVDEGTGETFTVTISSLAGGGGSASLGTSSVSTTIADDDNAPSDIALSVSPNSLGEDDSATEVTVTATLNGGTTRASDTVVTIKLAGTATKDTDYAATSLASVTIPANTASGTDTITITPTDDTVVEGDETITVSGTTTVNLDVSSAEITLTDDDKSTTTPGDKDDGHPEHRGAHIERLRGRQRRVRCNALPQGRRRCHRVVERTAGH